MREAEQAERRTGLVFTGKCCVQAGDSERGRDWKGARSALRNKNGVFAEQWRRRPQPWKARFWLERFASRPKATRIMKNRLKRNGYFFCFRRLEKARM